MKKSRYIEEQIIGVLKQMEAGRKVADLARELGVSEATLYTWKSKYGGMDPGPGSAEVGDPKKRLELVGRRQDVAPPCCRVRRQ